MSRPFRNKRKFFSELFKAVYCGNLVQLKTMISAGANVNKVRHENRKVCTPVMIAVEQQFFNCLQVLIKSGARPFVYNSEQNIVFPKHLEDVKTLIEAGANPIEMVAHLQDEECLKFLCENKIDDMERNICLLLSSKRANHVAVKGLIQAGADVNIVDKHGNTSLMLALGHEDIINSRLACVQTLIQAGANVNAANTEGDTPLILAVRLNCSKNYLVALLQAGASCNVQNTNGKTALMIVREKTGKDCFELLLEHKSDVNLQDKRGKTALIYAIEKKRKDWLELLLKYKSDVNLQDKHGKTALMYTIQKRRKDWLELLLEHKSDVNLQDKHGKTALMYAIEKRKEDWLELLLEHKSDVNLQDKHGKTVLMYAIEERRTYFLGPLLDDISLINDKADLNIQDEDGKTALMHAVSNNLFKYAETLIIAGADTDLKDKSNCSALVHLLKCTEPLYLPIYQKEKLLDVYKTLIFFLKKGVSPVVEPCHRKLLHCLPSVTMRTFTPVLFGLYSGILEILPPGLRTPSIERFISEQEIQLLVCNGVMNECFDSEGNYKSALGCALKCKHYGVVKYLFATCYLTNHDMSDLRQTFKKVEAPSRQENQAMLENIVTQAVCQPWPLVKLAFIAVSTILGPGPERQFKVKQTHLPDKLQSMLMFQEPVSRLPVSEWEDIPLTFDPVEYEKWPKPRPLLYYWPVGRDLVV